MSDVRIENRVGKNLVTKQEVVFSIYDVFLGGKHVAHIGWEEGSKLIYICPVSPVEKKKIEEKLPSLINQSFTSTPFPSIDPELVEGIGFEDDYYEFDEE